MGSFLYTSNYPTSLVFIPNLCQYLLPNKACMDTTTTPKLVTWPEVLAAAKATNGRIDTEILQLAYDMAEQAHRGQIRASGEPYIHHPLAVAKKLIELQTEQDVVVAGLLHDVPEDTDVPIEVIQKDFGTTVANLVAGVTKLSKIKYRGMERYAENLRKMFVAMSSDIRVILIKFADRWHNLTTLGALPEDKRARIAREVIEIYAPIADRLGMGVMKTQLEEMAFAWLDPKDYKWTTKLVESSLPVLEKNLHEITEQLIGMLKKNNITIISVNGRRKGIYSLYKKLLARDRDINRVFDLIALRIIVPDISSCYHALGLIHSVYVPMPGRMKDYIALPKANGYQSLHTTVLTGQSDNVDGKQHVLEIQIRTEEMHEQAEYGITASHWQYKERGSKKRIDQQLQWVHELVEWQRTASNEELIEGLRADVFKNRIFILTPSGDPINLPDGATPIDFAYAVHTDIGNSCVGARINGNMVSLDTELKSGDMVEILTDKNRKKPNPDWIQKVVTSHARSKIRQRLRESQHLREDGSRV